MARDTDRFLRELEPHEMERPFPTPFLLLGFFGNALLHMNRYGLSGTNATFLKRGNIGPKVSIFLMHLNQKNATLKTVLLQRVYPGD